MAVKPTASRKPAAADSADSTVPDNIEGEFITKLAHDPAHLPDVIMLLGYPGPSALDGYTRLYFAADLADYYEIPSDAIQHIEKATDFPGPSGAAYIWVRRSAEIIRKGRYTPDLKARFFSGSILKDYLGTLQSTRNNNG